MPKPKRSKNESSRKRTRPHTSDEDSTQAVSECRLNADLELGATRKSKSSSRTVTELQQSFKKSENERKKLDAKLDEKKEQLKESKKKLDAQTRVIQRMTKEKRRLKVANHRLEKLNKEMETDGKKLKKKIETYRSKLSKMETEKTQLESRVSSLQLGQGPSGSISEAGAVGGAGLFQDMMDNFRELAETQLQCVVCSEVFIDAVSINCGHTFCDFCISEWRKKKNNCPVCRTNIRSSNPTKVLDEYSDKVFEQFVSEGGKQARSVLKEERAKQKAEATRPRRRPALENVSDNSVDSDETLEIRFLASSDSEDSDDDDDTDDTADPPNDSDVPPEGILFPMRVRATSGSENDSDRSTPTFSTLWRHRILHISSDSESETTDDDFILENWRRRHNRQQVDTSSSSSESESEDDSSNSSPADTE